MKLITDTEIRHKGMMALIEALGEVDAERFVSLIIREPFDYTAWQKEMFQNMSVKELSKKAMENRQR